MKTDMPFPTQIFLAFGVFGACFFLATLFFWLSRNVALKRKLLPFIATGLGLVFLYVPWAAGFPREAFYSVIPMAALAVFMSARAVRFCNSCGVTIYDRSLWSRAKFCAKCGVKL